MPYVKMTKEQRMESRRNAIEKANATRAKKLKTREPTSYIRVSKSSLELLNKMAFELDYTQLKVVDGIIKLWYEQRFLTRHSGGTENG